jgi:site-specific DNA-methyltransferase (adenine-specific)
MKKYQIIYADPPYYYANNKKRIKYGGACMTHYPMMKLEDLKRLNVSELCANASVLFLWTPCPRLKDALELIETWGFKYRTCGFIWVKKYKNGKLESGRGMGFWTKENAEICLLATRYVEKGRNQIKRIKGNVSQIVICERNHHSEKPDEVRKRIVELLGDLPRIELFARKKAEGWDSWGNEITCDTEVLTNP